MPGVTVNSATYRHCIPANHVWSWRTLAKKGRLLLPAPEDPVEFAALVVGGDESAGEVRVDGPARPEIVAGSVIIRLEAGASADRIACVVRALAAHQ